MIARMNPRVKALARTQAARTEARKKVNPYRRDTSRQKHRLAVWRRRRYNLRILQSGFAIKLASILYICIGIYSPKEKNHRKNRRALPKGRYHTGAMCIHIYTF